MKHVARLSAIVRQQGFCISARTNRRGGIQAFMGGFGKIQERQKPNLAGTHVNSEKKHEIKSKIRIGVPRRAVANLLIQLTIYLYK
jgi:hypothetical protein